MVLYYFMLEGDDIKDFRFRLQTTGTFEREVIVILYVVQNFYFL